MKPFSDQLNNMMELIPYLGNEKYQDLLQMTRKYHNCEDSAQKVTDSGNIEDTQMTHKANSDANKSIDPEEAAEKRQEIIKNSLKNLDDEIVGGLFISIINLIKYFCIED